MRRWLCAAALVLVGCSDGTPAAGATGAALAGRSFVATLSRTIARRVS